MSYITHHAIVVHISGYALDGERALIRNNTIAAFRESLPEEFRPLMVGPIPTAINGDYVVALLPDGSKEGWDTSNLGDQIRQNFTELFAFQYDDGSSPYDIAEVVFGEGVCGPLQPSAYDPRKGL